MTRFEECSSVMFLVYNKEHPCSNQGSSNTVDRGITRATHDLSQRDYMNVASVAGDQTINVRGC